MELVKKTEISKETYFNRLEKLVRKVGEETIKEDTLITPYSKFEIDLGLDSLDIYELLYMVEDEFKVSIPDENAKYFEAIVDYYDYLVSKNNSVS